MAIDRWVKTYKEQAIKEPAILKIPDEALIANVLLANHISFEMFHKCRDVFVELYPLVALGTGEEQLSTLGEEETKKVSIINTAKLAICFGDANLAIEYLKRFESSSAGKNRRIIHDACLFTLAEKNDWTLKLWQAIVINNSPVSPNDFIMRLLPYMGAIETYVHTNKQKLEAELRESLKETVTQEMEQNIAREYDESQVAKTGSKDEWISANMPKASVIKKDAHFRFEKQLREQMELPVTGKLEKDQMNALTARLKNKTDVDNEVLARFIKIIEMEHQVRLNREYDSILNNSNQEKQEYVREQIKKAEGTITAIIEDRIKSRLFSPTTSVLTLFQYARNNVFKRANENPQAAELFFIYGMSEERFNEYLKMQPMDDPKRIPDVIIEGNSISDQYKNYVIMKLPKTDPRCALLGKLTSSCQSLGDHGSLPATYIITERKCGAYVLIDKTKMQDGKQGAIVSQCMAWREKGKMVFDSIETQVNFANHHADAVIALFTQLAYRLVAVHGIDEVLVGVGGETPKYIGQSSKTSRPVRLKGLVQYGDSRKQRIIAADDLPMLEAYKTTPYILPPDFNPNKQDSNGQTILHLMAETWNPNGVQAAIANAGDITITDNKGQTPLMLAFSEQNWNMIEYLLRFSKQTDKINNKLLVRIFFGAIKSGYHNNFIIWMAKTFKDCINARDSESMTALHLLSTGSNTELVAGLLDNGADINARNKDGMTPFAYARKQQDSTMRDLLVERGADLRLNAENIDSQHHLTDLASFCEWDKINHMLNAVEPQPSITEEADEALIKAANQKRWDIFARMNAIRINRDMDIILLNKLLTSACTQENIEVVKSLLSQPLAKKAIMLTENGVSLPEQACKLGNLTLATLLLDYCADVIPKSAYSQFIPSAILSGNLEVVKLLKERGADLNYWVTSRTKPYVNLAAQSADSAMLDYLLSNGSCTTGKWSDIIFDICQNKNDPINLTKLVVSKYHIDIKVHNGEGNAIHIAAIRGNAKLIRPLVDLGIDINAKNSMSHSPLAKACVHGTNLETIRALISAGADVNLSTLDPLDKDRFPFIWGTAEPLLSNKIADATHTPLTFAVMKCRNKDTVLELLDAGASLNPYPPLSDRSILDILIPELRFYPVAALDLMKILLERGADPKSSNRDSSVRNQLYLWMKAEMTTQPKDVVDLYKEVMNLIDEIDIKKAKDQLLASSEPEKHEIEVTQENTEEQIKESTRKFINAIEEQIIRINKTQFSDPAKKSRNLSIFTQLEEFAMQHSTLYPSAIIKSWKAHNPEAFNDLKLLRDDSLLRFFKNNSNKTHKDNEIISTDESAQDQHRQHQRKKSS